jgi:hypothetical protein
VPLRAAGAALIQDLHPDDRGPHGTHHGAIIANGNRYCPATPRLLLELGPLARDATPDQVTAHDRQTAETARHKPGKITSDDLDGYHRVMRPALLGNLRCYALNPWPWTGSGPRSSPHRQIHRPAAPSRPSPSPPQRTPRPRRNTTTTSPYHGSPSSCPAAGHAR